MHTFRTTDSLKLMYCSNYMRMTGANYQFSTKDHAPTNYNEVSVEIITLLFLTGVVASWDS
jgi:hypothetical protein